MVEQVLKNNLPQSRGDRGFSLIELMIAVTVLTVGLVSIVGMSVSVSRANSTSNILSVLATTAQEQADKLRLAVWTTTTEDPKLTLGGDINYSSSNSNHRTTVTGTPAGTLNVSWKVSTGPGTKDDVRTVTIKVVQDIPARGLANGITVTMIVYQN
jgi:prepilin-type N-terminal cleavage/methylation domain-containing protein